MDCGLGNTAESCGSCGILCQGGNDPNADCQKEGQPPKCMETGNCSKAKLFQETKNIVIDFLMPT